MKKKLFQKINRNRNRFPSFRYWSKWNNKRIFLLVEQNEFSKHFKSADIDIYLAKSYDEENNVDYLMANIPVIPETRTEHIAYPMPFPNAEERDKLFSIFNEQDCNDMIDNLIRFMKEQTEFLNDEQKKIDQNKNNTIDTDFELTQ